jgi:hypothetical protein
MCKCYVRSRDSSVGIAYLRAAGSTAGVRFLEGEKDFSLVHSFDIDFGAHPVFYSMGTEGSFHKSKVDWA